MKTPGRSAIRAVALAMLVSAGSVAWAGSDKVVVFSDSHIHGYGNAEMDNLRDLIQDINAGRGRFRGTDLVICTGDCVSRQFTDSENHLAQFTHEMNKLNVPWYAVMGNHEYKLDHSESSEPCEWTSPEKRTREELWKSYTGNEAYTRISSLNNDKWSYYLINTYRGCGPGVSDRNDDAGRKQGRWLHRRVLRDYEKGRKVAFFQHHAPKKVDDCGAFGKWGSNKADDEGYEEVLDTFASRIEVILTGHGHHGWCKDNIEGGEIRVLMTPSLTDAEFACERPTNVLTFDENGDSDRAKQCNP